MIKIFSIAVLVLVLAGPAGAQTPAPAAAPAAAAGDAAGTWTATFNTQNGQIPAEIKLTRAGAKLTGTISSQMGESPLEAEQKDKSVAMWFTMSGQNGPIAIELNGTVDGDTLKGTASAGGSPAGDFVASRVKPDAAKAPAKSDSPAAPPATAAVALTGNWSLAVELPNMTATPSLVLKQDGEKLTGEYVSAQYGKFPVTGTVKGTEVTFWFAMNVEGTALNVTYTGKSEKDAITGSVNYGDMMNGTFTATRQK
jgi:hypothetical protein